MYAFILSKSQNFDEKEMLILNLEIYKDIFIFKKN